MQQIITDIMSKYDTNCPFELADYLHIEIRELDYDPEIRGSILTYREYTFIGINMHLTDEWKRFVCAHEIAHYFSHDGMNRFFTDSNSLFVAGKYEREANQFAIRLLLGDQKPEEGETITNFFKRNGIPTELASFYK